jgi:hypothetical protein
MWHTFFSISDRVWCFHGSCGRRTCKRSIFAALAFSRSAHRKGLLCATRDLKNPLCTSGQRYEYLKTCTFYLPEWRDFISNFFGYNCCLQPWAYACPVTNRYILKNVHANISGTNFFEYKLLLNLQPCAYLIGVLSPIHISMDVHRWSGPGTANRKSMREQVQNAYCMTVAT